MSIVVLGFKKEVLAHHRKHCRDSYWDPSNNGRVFSVFEVLLGIALSIFLFVRFKSWLARVPLIALLAAYLLVPFYFAFQLGGF